MTRNKPRKIIEVYQDHADAKTLERLVKSGFGGVRVSWKKINRKDAYRI